MASADTNAFEKAAPARIVSLGFVALLLVYALTHPFSGLTGDAQIYMGRALADNDPAGVGRDLMYRLDGQSRFSIFPPIAAWIVAHMSLLSAAMCMVAASSLLWLCSALALARAVAPARTLAVAAVVVLAPTAYGGFNMLRYAEALAVPRPFAEAFVLLAVAAFLSERRIAALACLVVAALFHPIMALAGIAALGLALCLEDRRWLVAAALAVLSIGVAAVAGLPLADRLRVVLDADWFGLLASRNAYLFPHLWPANAWALPLVQAITIAFFAREASPPLRRVLWATLAVGCAGLFVATVAGRYDPVLLVIQAQLWRMWWLTAVLAALALALCALDCGAASAPRKLALALLALAWAMAQEAGLYAPAIAALAFVVVRLRPEAISPQIARAVWLGAALAVIMPLAVDLPYLRLFAGLFQSDFTPSLFPFVLKFLLPPLLFGAVAVAAFGPPRLVANLPQAAFGALTIFFAGIVGLTWNDASSFDKRIGVSSRQADLEKMMPVGNGDVLWLYASMEPWIWLGRPGWSADVQGAGAVFSRELAITYRDRARAQIEQGLRDETMIQRVPYRPKSFHPTMTPAAVAAICRGPDAPSYIVAPVRTDAALDPALRAKLWTPPAVRVETLFRGAGVDFPRIDRYAIMDCADRN